MKARPTQQRARPPGRRERGPIYTREQCERLAQWPAGRYLADYSADREAKRLLELTRAARQAAAEDGRGWGSNTMVFPNTPSYGAVAWLRAKGRGR